MARWMHVFAILIAVQWLAAPASGQPEAFLLAGALPGCGTNCAGAILRLAPDTPAVSWSVLEPAARSATSAYVTPDGRALVWFVQSFFGEPIQPPRIAIRDFALGRTDVFVVPGATAVVGNPMRPEVYVFDETGVSAIAPGGTRRFSGPACIGTLPGRISGDGSRLLYYCFVNANFRPTLLVDTASGQPVATLPQWFHFALTKDGSAAYVVTGGHTPHLQKIDTSSQAILADTIVPGSGGITLSWTVHVDDRHNRVWVIGNSIHVFDGATLDLQGSRWVDPSGDAHGSASDLDALNDRLYLNGLPERFATTPFSLQVLDTNTLSPVLVTSGGIGRFVPVPKPLTPAGFTASISGSRVTFSWTPSSSPPMTTLYLMEAGSAPGLADIVASLDVGLQTSLTANGVPPGTYYVRVRAANYAGLSAPSNEVTVHVP